MEWRGYSTSAQFREGTELLLKILMENKANKLLADIEDMTLIGMEDQRYIEFNFLPRAMQNGFDAVAIVKPSNYFNKVAVESISYTLAKAKLQLRLFNNTKEAKQWLLELPPSR
nr:STAS/SEC14 domain-containing protein [Chryseosolibacter indicus]